jgi:hypothetical protein
VTGRADRVGATIGPPRLPARVSRR